MARVLAIVAVAGLLVAALYYGGSGTFQMANPDADASATATAKPQNQSQDIVAVAPADDAASIRTLVQDYYAALRAKEYDRAATFYEPGTFDGTGLKPAEALKTASEFMGVPRKVSAEAIRVNGDKAIAEIVIPTPKHSIVSIELSENGKHLGTVARTLNFAKRDGRWLIAEDSTQNELTPDAQALLDRLQRK